MNGNKITFINGTLNVPDQPIIPFIEGDGTGPDIWAAAVRVFDAVVAKTYNGKRQIIWKEVMAGEKAFKHTGSWLPEDTLKAFREYIVGIKGPLTTPTVEVSALLMLRCARNLICMCAFGLYVGLQECQVL